eukprot:scaffold388_cov114-Cylindrotheca_fusiformis.AAC.12
MSQRIKPIGSIIIAQAFKNDETLKDEDLDHIQLCAPGIDIATCNVIEFESCEVQGWSSLRWTAANQ